MLLPSISTRWHGVLLTLSSSLAPYERRVIELLRNGKDKRARKLAKKRVSRRRYCLAKGRRLITDILFLLSLVHSAVPRPRSTSSRASSPRPVAQATKQLFVLSFSPKDINLMTHDGRKNHGRNQKTRRWGRAPQVRHGLARINLESPAFWALTFVLCRWGVPAWKSRVPFPEAKFTCCACQV